MYKGQCMQYLYTVPRIQVMYTISCVQVKYTIMCAHVQCKDMWSCAYSLMHPVCFKQIAMCSCSEKSVYKPCDQYQCTCCIHSPVYTNYTCVHLVWSAELDVRVTSSRRDTSCPWYCGGWGGELWWRQSRDEDSLADTSALYMRGVSSVITSSRLLTPPATSATLIAPGGILLCTVSRV